MYRFVCVIGCIGLAGCGGATNGSGNNSNVAIDAAATVCGDGEEDHDEECDDGTYNSDTRPDACRSDCRQFYCGDGVRDSDESCDGQDLNSFACQDLQGFVGGTLGCNQDCSFDTSGCSTCGNGVIDVQEQCDGTDLQGASCESLGHDAGQLLCGTLQSAAPCAFDESACLDSPYCGDGVVDTLQAEQCDGLDTNGEDCLSMGFFGGELHCDAQCSLDVSQCDPVGCGNNVREAAEICDGIDTAGADCVSQGYVQGTLACAADCLSFDESGCSGTPVCGDGVIEGLEACDGTNLAGETCFNFGYIQGSLACMANCLLIDTNGCSGASACVSDHNLGTLQTSYGHQLSGSMSSNDHVLSCGSSPAPEVVVQFSLTQPGNVLVTYSFGSMLFSHSRFAIYSASLGNCSSNELECHVPAGDGQSGSHTFTSLGAGYYYLIIEADGLGFLSYSVEITLQP
ncbi:MAG: hypothetical protein ABI333_19555 [bacterium]